MVRISAIFVAVCMILIAGSIGAVAYLRFGLTGAEASLVALGVLTALAIYNAIAGRFRDRSEVSDQIATLSRGSGDLARQVAEFDRRLGAIELKLDTVLDKALATAQPLAAEVEELSTLVKRLADQVAEHETDLHGERAKPRAAFGLPPGATASAVPAEPPPAQEPGAASTPVAAAVPPVSTVAAFKGLDQDGIAAAIKSAIEGSRIDLYLQPIVTLPQRKVRYYEAVSRLRADNGDIVAAGDFLKFAEAGGLMPKLDNLTVLRCVQVVRRLLLKNRDIGLFCNLSMATLADASFPQLLEFVEANRAIAPSLVFEFSQGAVRTMGPIEHESLAALAEGGFRFSMDHLTDLRLEPRELTERGFRFIKASAKLLLNRVGVVSTDIHPADLSDLLGRFGIDLIAERIEAEGTVVDLLDYDVRFGQGFLFSPPRPVRPEALAGAEPGKIEPVKGEATKPEPPADNKRAPAAPAPSANITTASRGILAQLARTARN